MSTQLQQPDPSTLQQTIDTKEKLLKELAT